MTGRLGKKIKNWWSTDYTPAIILIIVMTVLAIILRSTLFNDSPCKGDESVCDCKTVYVENRNLMVVCIMEK